jgi:hypothetical protein
MGWCSPDEFEGLGSSQVRGVQDAGRHTNERRARDLALWLQQRWWVRVRVRARFGVSILVDVLGDRAVRGVDAAMRSSAEWPTWLDTCSGALEGTVRKAWDVAKEWMWM